jgi:hypothetical protein
VNLKTFIIATVSVTALVSSFSTAWSQQSHDSLVVHNVREIFSEGHFHGHFRNYFMATDNRGDDHDFWTNATGGALHYSTANWKGFEAGVKGIFTYRTASSDLYNEEDPRASARWETELYDVHRPEVGNDLDRLEELYLRYRSNLFWVTYGKQNIDEGPLLLERDGRMNTFVYRGFWSGIETKKHSVRLGFIDGVSPRGMTDWFSLNEAIGQGGNGFEPNGIPAEYHETSSTRGLAVVGYKYHSAETWTNQAWAYVFDRISSTYWFQSDWETDRFFAGLQYVHQHPLPKQSKLDYPERYLQPDERADVISGQAGFKKGRMRISGAYLHAFDNGRFLYPREMGRENFYVSQPRSWVDGLGKLDIYQIGAVYEFKKAKQKLLNFAIFLNRVETTGLNNVEFNKYNLPVYNQVTSTITHQFGHLLKGLELSFLYVARLSEETGDMTPEEMAYRTNFHHFNLIANVNF